MGFYLLQSRLIRARLSDVIRLIIGVSGDVTVYYSTAIVTKSENISFGGAYNTTVYFLYEHDQ